jgi:hypothetical protein
VAPDVPPTLISTDRRPGGFAFLFGRVDAHEWVRRFQVREEPGRQLRFLLDVRRTPSAAQHHELRHSVETALGREFRVEFELMDRIPNAPSGKLQYLVPLAS